MTKTILLIILSALLGLGVLHAQDDRGYLLVKGTIKIDRAALEGAKVKIYENGTLTKTYPTDASGKFECKVSLNINCKIEVVKQGFFSKNLEIKTTIPQEDIGIWTYRFSMGLIREIEGFDASLLDEPIGKIMFVDDFGDFDYDAEYTNAMQRKIKAMMKEYEKKLREAFNKIIIQADDAFNNGDYDLAEELYDKAIDLDPYDPYPDDQIAMIGKIRKQDTNNDKNYEKNITLADEYFNSLDYTNAKLYYTRATKYKEEEQYPKDQIAWIVDYLNGLDDDENNLAEQDRLYNAAMSQAERSFSIKQYDTALNKYTEASGIKPNEQLPKDKIAELNLIISQLASANANKAEIDKAYAAAIASADASYNTKSYSTALQNYKKAITIKPSETYPRTRITEIENILAAGKSVDDKYNGFIAVADQSLTSKQYQIAQKNYQSALGIKPNEQYPKTKLAEIDALLLLLANQKLQAKDAEYSRVIAQADASFNNKEYNNAKGLYSQALLMKENEVYPKQQMDEIDRILGDLATKKRAYDLAIARADNSFNVEQWEKAKVDYTEALRIYPAEQYPQSRLIEIENKLLALKNAEDQMVAREQAYLKAINKADSLYGVKKYLESKNTYNQALSIKPKETYPQERIEDINNLLAQQKALDERYATYISSADKLFMAQSYEGAKGDYIKASQIKQNEAYPKTKIAEIDKLLEVALLERKKQESIQEEYNGIIQQADIQFNSKSWNAAMGLYNQALLVKPEEAYPKQRIGEINSMLAGLAEKERAYNDAIATGDELFKNKAFNESMVFYNQALGLKPNESYPKAQIEAINAALADMQQKEAQFANYIKIADAAYTNNALDKAKAQYQAALLLKPTAPYPRQRIAEIDALIMEQQKQMAAQDKLNAQYNSLIASADESFKLKAYDQAKNDYSQALMLKSTETYPKEKLTEIDNLLKALAAKRSTYDAKIAEADGLYQQKNYNGALKSFTAASLIMPDESYPKEKIAALNALIADNLQKQQKYERWIAQADQLFKDKQFDKAKPMYQQALVVLPNEAYPQQRIVEIDALILDQQQKLAEQQKIDAQYDALIVSADQLFLQQRYDEAKNSYNQALFLKDAETYPKQKLAEIDAIIKNLAAVQLKYDNKIAEADNYFNKNDLVNALANFKEAQQLKPDEVYPKEKITAISALIAQNKQKQQQYDALISKADQLFNSKKYSDSKSLYQNALMVLPNESYPKNQLAKVDQFMADEAKQNAALAKQMQEYQAKITQADALFDKQNYEQAISLFLDAKSIKSDESYPDEQIARINQIVKQNQAKLESDFNNAIKEGDQLVSNKNYPNARLKYQLAQDLKPNDPLPKAKLSELDNLIDKERLNQANQAKLNEQYDNYLKQADNSFNAKDYATAIAFYQSAKGLKPQEQYPKDRIALCENKMREQKVLAAEEAEKRKQAELAATASSFGGSEFDYKGEKRDEKFLNDLGKQYPEGVTIENYDKPNKKIKRVIVNNNGIAKEYVEVTYSYGTFYFRNGQNISRSIFYSETKK